MFGGVSAILATGPPANPPNLAPASPAAPVIQAPVALDTEAPAATVLR